MVGQWWVAAGLCREVVVVVRERRLCDVATLLERVITLQKVPSAVAI